MYEAATGPWPWYVAGPLIGLLVPVLHLLGRRFGVSSSLRHACAAMVPGKAEYFRYDWRSEGGWNLIFVFGILLGGVAAATLLPSAAEVDLAPATRAALETLGLHDFGGLAPSELFAWDRLASVGGFMAMVVGGFLVGFGTRYANGCTSGHAITGLAELRLSSLGAVLGFFAGGLAATHFLLPLVLGG